MKHDYKEGPYSTGTLIERLEEMCGRGEDRGVLLGRDVWPDDVLEAIERIKLLEKHMQLIITRTKYRGGSFDDDMPDVVCAIARDALEGKER